MQLALIGAAAVIVLVASAAIALQRIRHKPPLSIIDPYNEPYSAPAQIVARRLDGSTLRADLNRLRLGEGIDEHLEVAPESDPFDPTEVGALLALDRLLEPPEWPEDLSTRHAQRSGIR